MNSSSAHKPGGPLLSVIMPCYNERATVREILRRVSQVKIDKEILAIDDASGDGTLEILQQLAKEIPELRVLRHPQNRGKGAALRTGFAKARGQVLVIQDADLEYNPQDYPRLLAPILEDRADVVFGSRFSGSERRVLMFWHTVGNRLLTACSNVCTNLNLTDMETCYKAFRRDVIQSISLRSDRFGFEPEFTQKVARLGCRIYEVPISYNGRDYVDGKKINWKDGVAACYTILRHWLIEDSNPETAGYQTLNRMRLTGRYNAWIFKLMRPYLGERVLELGCGTGNLTRYIRRTAQVTATEIDEQYLPLLQEMFEFSPEVRVAPLDLERFDPAAWRGQNYSCLVLVNVLEHLPDDRRTLQSLRQIAAPETRLFLLVPAHPALYGELDRQLKHLRRYTSAGLGQLLSESGWEVEHLTYLNSLGALGWWINSRLLRRRLLGRLQLRLFNLIVPLARGLDRLRLPFGLSLVAVCRPRKNG